jgi:hypothetical protein
MWIGRLGFARNRLNFIFSRLARTSREEIPRFRFDFKYCKREVGDHVHRALANAFVEDYLEPDGYFFIRMLTVNASDFIVQEIIEQLWSCYVLRYGEGDAKKAEDAYYAFRDPRSASSPPTTPIQAPILDEYGATDARRKYLKQRSEPGIGLSKASSVLQPLTTATQEPNQHV